MSRATGAQKRQYKQTSDDAAELVVAVGELESKVVKSIDAINEAVKQANEESKTASGMSEETKGQLLSLVEKLTETHDRLDGIEEKQAKLIDDGKRQNNVVQVKSIGQQFIEGKAFKDVEGKIDGRIVLESELKAITNAAPGNDQPLVQTDRLAGIIRPQDTRLSIRDLLPQGRITSNNHEFTKELVFTNAANYQEEEGDAKPESNITFELDSKSVATIAHWIHVSKQVMADAPILQSYIDGRLRYGLKLKEEQELLNGNDAAGHLHGLIPQATAYAGVVGQSRADQVRRGMHVVELAEYPADGLVMHPSDWLEIELAKDADQVYYFGGPANATQPRLWGRPVVTSQSLAVGQFMTGAFQMAAQVFDREEVNVAISSEDRDNFIKNMLTMRCEERLVLVVYRPASFVVGTFG